MKLWTVSKLNKTEALEIQNKYNLPPIIAMLLQIRNIKSADEIEDFLFNESVINSPFEIKDMDKAVTRIKRAVDSGELICVYGDYDADGVTSTALLYSYLEAVGANVMYYIPSRETEGYGMNMSAVDFLSEKGVGLIVTVDNGIAAAKEIEHASSLGIDTVVTDHHMPQETLPNAYAVVDLHREDCKSSFKELCGAGVAFKLVMALEGEYGDVDSMLDNYADLLSIGTIGDIVELRGENRVFVKRGLKSIANGDRVGIEALVQGSGLDVRKLSAGNVSFTLVPRINAVGRLGQSGKSVELLLTEDEETANEITQELCFDNSQRRMIEAQILDEINNQIIKNPALVYDRIIVIDGENWHQGVIGIVASRIKDAYGKPAIIISRFGDTAKASGRSVEGFSLCDAVFACSDLLTHCGGHPMAVGLSLESSNIAKFREKINDYANSFSNMPFDRLKIDCKLNPAFINTELVSSLSYLQPYGSGNPTPVFGLYNMTLEDIIPLSNNKHLKLSLSRNNSRLYALYFFMSSEQFPYKKGESLDLAVTLDTNEYNGNISVSVIIKDIKSSLDDTEEMLKSERIYEDFCSGRKVEPDKLCSIIPKREDFALLYRFLKSCSKYEFPCDTLVHKLDNRLSFGKIKVILKAMSELGLISYSEGISTGLIAVNDVSGKVSLESSPIIKKLNEGCQRE